MKITNVKIYGLEESAIASGYPMMTKTPSEDVFEQMLFDASIEKEDWKPFDRLCNLGSAKSGSGHDSSLKGVIVQYDLTCNHVMLPQIMRYHYHDIISSQSKMHKILTMDLQEQCDSNVDIRIIEIVNEKIREYKEMQSVNKDCGKLFYSNEQLNSKFEEIVNNIPLGFNLTMRYTSNYLQLKSEYIQRRLHKMNFWQDKCDWIETLPLMNKVLQLNQ